MNSKGMSVLAAALLTGSGSTNADQPAPAVVAVHYVVSGQLAERLEKMVLVPLERRLVALARVTNVTSIASDGYVNIEVHFEGGASEQDLAAVNKQVEEVPLELVVTSRTVHLAPPHAWR